MSAHRHPLRITVALAALTLSLAGCGILPKKEPLQAMTSQAHVEIDPSWPQVRWQLTIARPSTNEMLDSRRMAVSPAPGQIQVYKGYAWEGNVPDIVQDTVIHAFQDSGKIPAVGHQTSGLHTDFLLQMDIRDDQAVYRTPAGPPEVVLVVTASLIDYSSSRAVASQTFRQVAPASGNGVPAVAQAFDTALGALVHDVVGWTLVTGQKHPVDDGAAKH